MDVRWYAIVVVSGLVLPVLTVIVALDATLRMDIPPLLTFALLVIGPLVSIVLTYAMTLYSGVSVPFDDAIPFGSGGRQFKDQVPEQYHDTFAAETLDAPAEPASEGTDTLLTAYLVYLSSVPVYGLIAWLLLVA